MDPTSLVAAGIHTVGALFKGISSLFGGIHANQAEKMNALQAREEAGVAAQQSVQQGEAAAARGATQAAANGGGFGGSTLGVLSWLSQQSMFNARAQVYRGEAAARADLYSGKQALAQGIQGGISGGVDAASSLVGGFMSSAANARQMRANQSYGGDDGADLF